MTVNLTCIECPMGCAVKVETEDGKVLSVTGNTCPRGKMYAENEVVCPRRVVTSTVRAENGEMVSVKTDKPVRKDNVGAVMSAINAAHPKTPLKIGDVIIKDIESGIDVVATGNLQ